MMVPKIKTMPRVAKPVEPSLSSESESLSESASYTEESSVSEEEAPVPEPKKRRTRVDTPVPEKKEKREKRSRHSSKAAPAAAEADKTEDDDEDDAALVKTQTQAIFDGEYAKRIKRSSGKNPSTLPQNTNLYIKQENALTGKRQWVVAVRGQNNYASDRALQKAKEFLDAKDYKASFRVEAANLPKRK